LRALCHHEAYHVEGDDIAERDIARLIPLDKKSIDNLRAAASRETQHKWLVCGGIEALDPACVVMLVPSLEESPMQVGIHTDDVLGNVLRDS
jgi:hypothetical protein